MSSEGQEQIAIPLTSDRLARMRSLCEQATAGPWTSWIEGRDFWGGSTIVSMAGNDVDDLYLSVVGGEVASDADHDFVASAREGVPTLLAEVEQLRELLGEGGETKTAGVAGDAAVTAGPGQNLGLTDQQLTELKKLSGEATPGPWRSQVAGRDDWLESNLITTAAEPLSLSGATVADQDFIASARQDVPELLAEIERLQRALRNHLD